MKKLEDIAAVFAAHKNRVLMCNAKDCEFLEIPYTGDNCSLNIQVFARDGDKNNYTVLISSDLAVCPEETKAEANELINDINEKSPFMTFFMEKDGTIRAKYSFWFVPEVGYGHVIYKAILRMFWDIDQEYYRWINALLPGTTSCPPIAASRHWRN